MNTHMSQEAEHAIKLIEWWKELTGLFIGIFALFGVMVRKKQAGKMLVTRDYLDNKLELHDEQVKNVVKDAVKDGLKEVYAEIHRVDGRIDQHVDKN